MVGEEGRRDRGSAGGRHRDARMRWGAVCALTPWTSSWVSFRVPTDRKETCFHYTCHRRKEEREVTGDAFYTPLSLFAGYFTYYTRLEHHRNRRKSRPFISLNIVRCKNTPARYGGTSNAQPSRIAMQRCRPCSRAGRIYYFIVKKYINAHFSPYRCYAFMHLVSPPPLPSSPFASPARTLSTFCASPLLSCS